MWHAGRLGHQRADHDCLKYVPICPALVPLVRTEGGNLDEPATAGLDGTTFLVEACRERLSAEEHYLSEQRALGRLWQELAEEFGMRVEDLRKRLIQAVNHLAGEVGLV